MSRKNTHNVLYLRERNGQIIIDGTTAVQIDGYENADSSCLPALRVVDRDKVERKWRRRLARAIATWSVMVFILAAGSYSLFWYIGTQSRLTQTATEVGTLESRYQALVTENDERLEQIEQHVDLDRIRERATDELHMHYATEGQTVYYVPEMQDSVTQMVAVGE